MSWGPGAWRGNLADSRIECYLNQPVGSDSTSLSATAFGFIFVMFGMALWLGFFGVHCIRWQVIIALRTSGFPCSSVGKSRHHFLSMAVSKPITARFTIYFGLIGVRPELGVGSSSALHLICLIRLTSAFLSKTNPQLIKSSANAIIMSSPMISIKSKIASA